MAILVLALLCTAVTACGLRVLRAFRISTLDATELASKLHVPRPLSARDWPELHIDEVVADPEVPWRILLLVRWPAHPRPRALLVIDAAGADQRALRLLREWRDERASVSPTRAGEGGLVLRRRRRPEQLITRIVDEHRAA